MQRSLENIQYAATIIIDSIWAEREEISKLEGKIDKFVRLAKNKYSRADDLQQNEDFDDYMMGVGLNWDTYFTEDKDAFYKTKELEIKKQTYYTHEFAINCLSAALLQMAKQGISIIQGGLVKCPNGRPIGTQHLKQIIWQARNQTIHFEEGSFNSQVIACFDGLTNEIDDKFGCFRTANMAFDVVDLLNWKSFNDFANDMLQLA